MSRRSIAGFSSLLDPSEISLWSLQQDADSVRNLLLVDSVQE
jgi:hypothetical protein